MTHYTATQVARVLGTSHTTVQRLIQSGELAATRLSDTGYYRIEHEEVERYCAARGITPHWDLLGSED